MCSAVFPAARKVAKDWGWELVEGTATWAEPGGMISRDCWQFLRDQLLNELRAAAPVDIVLPGLHGAMVARGCLDCEGDLLERVRKIAGPEVVVGATLDPHSHLSHKRVANADLPVSFKEFPHTDFVEAAEMLCDLAGKAARAAIKPHMSVFDCKMVSVFPTSREPMKSFVARMKAPEGRNGVLSVSAIHGFMAGDVPDMGSKIIVITDNDPERGAMLARSLGMEMFKGLRKLSS